MLVNELSQQLANTMYGGSGSDALVQRRVATDSSSDGSSSGGLLSGASAYASLIPQTSTSSIMDGGGLGIAEQFAQETRPVAAPHQAPQAQAQAQVPTSQPRQARK